MTWAYQVPCIISTFEGNYTGQIRKGKADGFGRFVDGLGRLMEGRFRGGKMHGYFRYIHENGYYQGHVAYDRWKSYQTFDFNGKKISENTITRDIFPKTNS